MKALGVNDLMRWAAVFGIAAAALSIYVGIVEAPIAGDIWTTRELQSWQRLADNETLINGIHPWRWVFLAVAAALVLVRRLLFGGGAPAARLRDETLIAFVLVALLSSGSVILKLLIGSPRPLEELGVHVEEFRDTYGHPSGHVYSNLLIYGALAVYAPGWVHPRLVLPLRALAVAVIVLSGPARVSVGAHWPSDTYGGYLWGACALLLAIAAARRLTGGRR